MPKSILFRQRVRLAAWVENFRSRNEGVAAVEFALIVPIMATLFIGAVEMSQAVTVNRRVTQVGSTTGDLVARADANISSTDITDIMKVGSYLLNPFPAASLKVDISVVSSSAANAATTTQKWLCSYDGANPNTVNCTCPNTAYAIPAGLVTTSDSVVIASVSYGYKPVVFDVFMKSAFTGPKAGGVYTMTEKVYLKPRAACPQITKADTTTCGC